MRRTTVVALLAIGLLVPTTAAADPGSDAQDPEWTEPAATMSVDPQELVQSAEDSSRVTIAYAVAHDDQLEIRTTSAPDEQSAAQTIAGIQQRPDVVAVDVEVTHRLAGTATSVNPAEQDPHRSEQWALDKLAAEQAWQSTTGEGVVVAVLDSGVARHRDLAGKFVPGVDFVGNSNGRQDGHGHGTHVAGIIGMTPNNGLGGAGLAPGVSIMPIVVADASGAVRAAASADGIVWAVDHGADVLNMSYSGTATSVEQKAIQYAHARGVVTVAAAGNSYTDAQGDLYNPVQYPAAFPGVLGVGAVTRGLERSAFSQVGKQVDIAAPGGNGSYDSRRGIFSTFGKVLYLRMSGTSMSAPYVSAAAALVISRARTLGVQVDVRDVLLASADDLGRPGRDDAFGHGLLSPGAALELVESAALSGAEIPDVPMPEIVTRITRRIAVKPGDGNLRFKIPRKGRFVVYWQRARKDSWSRPKYLVGSVKGRSWHRLESPRGQRVRVAAMRKGAVREQDPIWLSPTVRIRSAVK